MSRVKFASIPICTFTTFVEPSLIAHRHACPPTHTLTPTYKHMLLCVSARIWDCAEHNLESVPFGCRRSGFLDDSQCAIKPNKMANAHCRSRSNTITTQLLTHTHINTYTQVVPQLAYWTQTVAKCSVLLIDPKTHWAQLTGKELSLRTEV